LREEAIALVYSSERLIAEVATSLGLLGRTLWYWVDRHRKAHGRANDPRAKWRGAERAKRLLKEKVQQKIDVETLRKAAVYFAKETMRWLAAACDDYQADYRVSALCLVAKVPRFTYYALAGRGVLRRARWRTGNCSERSVSPTSARVAPTAPFGSGGYCATGDTPSVATAMNEVKRSCPFFG